MTSEIRASALAAAGVALVRANIEPSVQELLYFGDARVDVAPGALGKAIDAALSAALDPADAALRSDIKLVLERLYGKTQEGDEVRVIDAFRDLIVQGETAP